MSSEADTPTTRTTRTHVSASEAYAICLAAITEPKVSRRKLARRFGRSERTISTVLSGKEMQELSEQLAAEDRTRAMRILERASVEAATLWASTALPMAAHRGNHKPARDLLIATKAIEERPASTVMVAVGVHATFEVGES